MSVEVQGKITISGRCKVRDEDGADFDNVEQCVNCTIDGENFAYYCDHIPVKSSDAHFELRDGELYVVVEYECDKYLNSEQIEGLMEYTQGQWSDGIGECYEQMPSYVEDGPVYISMWYRGQEVSVKLS